MCIQPKSKPEDVSAIVGVSKRIFTQNVCKLHPNLKGKRLWQARFHDHIIRDEKDLKNHVDYLHFNPVQHGWARKPEDFQFSTFRKLLEPGEYQIGWGHMHPQGSWLQELPENQDYLRQKLVLSGVEGTPRKDWYTIDFRSITNQKQSHPT